uniref:Uncharacterized protein n=1 Tax=Trypanosoma brucei TaxID=5691 RepID=Q583A2_9TRYP|nr:hypothetical protein, unlikely [Trypanosoma brucei]
MFCKWGLCSRYKRLIGARYYLSLEVGGRRVFAKLMRTGERNECVGGVAACRSKEWEGKRSGKEKYEFGTSSRELFRAVAVTL